MKQTIVKILLGFLVSQSLYAINLQNYYFSDSYKYAVIEDSFLLKHPGSWLITASGAYVGEPLVIVEEEGSTDKVGVVVKQHLVGTLGFNYHVARWLSLRIDTHYVSQTMSDDAGANTDAQSNVNNTGNTPAYLIDGVGETRSGLGDLSVSAKIRLLYNRKNKLAIAFIPRVDINQGEFQLFNSSEKIAFGGLFTLEKYFNKRFGIMLGAGYRQSEQNELGVIDYDKIIRGQLGLTYRFNKKWNANLEIDHRETISEDSTTSSKQNSSDIYLTAKGKIAKPVSLYAGVGVAGFAESDLGNITGFLGVKIHAAPKAKVRKIKEPKVVTSALELASLDNQTVMAGDAINVMNAELITGGDVDANGNSVAYACSFDQVVDDTVIAGSACTNLDNLNFDTSTGQFAWTPGSQYSKQEFEFKIDGYMNGDLFDSEMFVITVEEPAQIVPDVLRESLKIAETVEFDTNKSTIRSVSYPALNDAASKIMQYESQIGLIEIQGHTDTRGSSQYNLSLSQRRADSVRNYLIRKGVNRDKLKSVGYGETQPLIFPEQDALDYQANRRTLFVVDETIEVQSN